MLAITPDHAAARWPRGVARVPQGTVRYTDFEALLSRLQKQRATKVGRWMRDELYEDEG